MKPFKTILLFTLFFTVSANAQLDKTNWLVGGTGSFNSFTREATFDYSDSSKSGTAVIQYNVKKFEVSPKVGYFIADKFAVGLVLSFVTLNENVSTLQGDYGGGTRNNFNYSTGPFVRYYLLNKENNFNLVTEVNYQIGGVNYSDEKGEISKLKFFIGPEMFFNSSVGMEILFGYEMSKQNMKNRFYESITESGFFIAIGFQIHLQKN